MSTHERSRIFGLDLVRAVAIVLVVVSHADDLLDAYWSADPGVSAVDGVDLFFVLSGCLIGGVLLRSGDQHGIPWWIRSWDFWQRRWLRTLPNYYLFLILNIILVATGMAPGLLNDNVLAYAVFLQNFHIPLDLFFWESWSLAVEEWFYLLFPLFALILAVPLGPRRGFLLAAVIMITLPALLRFSAMDEVRTPFQLDLFVRKIVLYRLDAIGYGVLVAWVLRYVPRFQGRYAALSFMVGAVCLVVATCLRSEDVSHYNGTHYFTLSALSMALMLPLLVSWIRPPVWGKGVVFLSRISFALYLVHVPVRSLLLPHMPGLSREVTVLVYVAYWIVCLALSGLVLRYWERPFMVLRDRLSAQRMAPFTS